MHLVLRLRGGMMHTSSGVVSPSNPLACTCYATLPASEKEKCGLGEGDETFIHGCGIVEKILESNTFCAACRLFNCGVKHG